MTKHGAEQPIVRRREVTKAFDGHTVLSDVSLDVAKSEVICIIGLERSIAL